MKHDRILSLLLSLILLFSLLALTACGDTEPSSDATATATASDTVGKQTDTATESASETKEVKKNKNTVDPSKENREYDPSLPHTVIVTDIKHAGLVVLDLNKVDSPEKLNDPAAIVWEWRAEDAGTKYLNKISSGIDDAKLRYSPYYGSDVVIACASTGWAGIIEYPSGKILLEMVAGKGPHSVELMPNGDFVVALSDTGHRINYYPVTRGGQSGIRAAASYALEGAHGVCWNPDLERLIVDGYTEIAALEVVNYGTKDKLELKRDSKYSTKFAQKTWCHDMMPMADSDGTLYYVSASDVLYRYEPYKRKLSRASGYMQGKEIKGLASFADGTLIATITGGEGNPTYDWSTCSIHVCRNLMKDGKVTQVSTVIYFPDREFYKVHVFDKAYI